MSKLISALRKMNIRLRIFVAVLVFVLLSGFAYFFLAGKSGEKLVEEYIYPYVINFQSQIVSGMETRIEQLTGPALRLQINQDLYSVLGSADLSPADKGLEIAHILNNFSVDTELIGGIQIIDKSGNNYFYSTGTMVKEPDLPEYLTRLRENSNAVPIWGPGVKDENGGCYIPYGTALQSFSTGQRAGYLVLYMAEDSLNDLYAQSLQEWQNTFVSDAGGLVVSHSDKELIGAASPISVPYLGTGQTYYEIADYQGQKSVIAYRRFSQQMQNLGLNWTLVSILSYKTLFQVVPMLRKTLFFLMAGIALISLFVAWFLSNRISASIRGLRDKISSVSGAEPEHVKIKGHDEISELDIEFDNMLGQIQKLMEANLEEKEKQRELELIALQAQINPHFLYNTLDTISWIARIEKQQVIGELVGELANFFRLSLSGGEREIPLASEVDLARSYAQIESIRNPGKINIHFLIDDGILHIPVIKLILQPLVENAIKHGISNKPGSGNIWLKGFRQDNDIILTVEDDGAGFDSQQKMPRTKLGASGYGIRNVNERLRLEYGEGYGLTVSSVPGEGTIATIRILIPLVYR